MAKRVAAASPKPGPHGAPPAPAPKVRSLIHFILLFVACLLVVNAVVGENGLLTMLRARQEYEDVATALEKARAENAQLREQKRRLLGDPAAIEEIARRELGLVKPGEKVFIIKDK